MEETLFNDKKYTFIENFKDNALLRKSFNSLTQKTFGFDFEQWYQAGYWGSGYIPYSLLEGENIVANVSASIMDFSVLGEAKRYIQFGTVMTDSAYRGQGLSRYLIEKVIGEWKNKCDMIYLFANNSVLNFYPKFGFTAVSEYQYSKAITNDTATMAAEKLDMSLDNNRKLVIEKVINSISMSKFRMLENAELIMFYCISYMSGNVYYIRELDAVAIASFEGDTLYLYDIFSASETDLDNIIMALSNKEIKTAVLGFTPGDTNGFHVDLLHEDGTTLFVMKDKADLFQNNKLMFPILSHT